MSDVSWKQVEELSILALRLSIQQELSGAVIVHIVSDKEFHVSGPDVTKQFVADYDPGVAAHPRFLATLYEAFVGNWLRYQLGPDWGDSFFAAAKRWPWRELFQETRIGEFDGMFAAVTKHLGVLFLVAEVKHHTRPVNRSLLESFAHRVRRVGANKGYFISTSGYQEGAILLAKREGIALIHMPVSDLSEMEHLYDQVEPGSILKPEHFTLLAAPRSPEYEKEIESRRPIFEENLKALGFILE